jgi:hypothetical protein
MMSIMSATNLDFSVMFDYPSLRKCLLTNYQYKVLHPTKIIEECRSVQLIFSRAARIYCRVSTYQAFGRFDGGPGEIKVDN